MTAIVWDQLGTRLFETGVDRGVLYPSAGAGVPWNGLISVDESSEGGEQTSLYFDGLKYLDFIAYEDYQATITAYGAPPEFDACDGALSLAPGLFATQQPRARFGFAYRTRLGNDLMGPRYGYKLHIVYNATASPSSKSYKTIGQTTEASERSWELHCVPADPASATYKPTAHLVINSTQTTAVKLKAVEDMLYGTTIAAPFLPTQAQVKTALT